MQTPKFEEPNYVTVTVFSNAQPMSIVNLRRNIHFEQFHSVVVRVEEG
jgi:hypothetical protein